MKKLLLSVVLACAFVPSSQAVWITAVDSSQRGVLVFDVNWFADWDINKTADSWGNFEHRWSVEARVVPEDDSRPETWPHHIRIFGGWWDFTSFAFDILFPAGRSFSEVVYDFRGVEPALIAPNPFTEFGARFTFGQVVSSVPDSGSSAALLGLSLFGVAAASRFSCSFTRHQ